MRWPKIWSCRTEGRAAIPAECNALNKVNSRVAGRSCLYGRSYCLRRKSPLNESGNCNGAAEFTEPIVRNHTQFVRKAKVVSCALATSMNLTELGLSSLTPHDLQDLPNLVFREG